MASQFSFSHSVGTNLILIAAATCGLAMHAKADIFNVPADYATIQDAIGPATDGDEIVIAPGTYAPFDIRSEDILFRSSGGPEVTIIDGGGTETCVHSVANGEGTFQGLTFTNGSGTNGGAVSFGFGSATLSFDNCIFSNNSNGAVASPVGGLLTFSGCTFVGNSGSQGGAIRTNTAACQFIDCTFVDNTATTLGGAIYLGGSADITITGCTFQGNSAPQGGAISNYNPFNYSGDQLDNCVFDGNTATGADGGGAIWTEKSIPITNCTFLNNSAQSGPGGAVHSTGVQGVVTLTNCAFDQNDATDGGGVWMNGGSVSDSAFTGNIASGNGGAMFVTDVDATNCPMDGNSAAGTGGAVHAESGAFTLINCDMSGNMAGVSGGGIYVPDLALVTISDSTLCLNTPDQYDFVGALLATNVFGCDITCPVVDPVGACCLPQGGCTLLTAETCLAVGGTYQGDGTDCGSAGCPPFCPADTNGDGVVNVTDLLNLLAAWGSCF